MLLEKLAFGEYYMELAINGLRLMGKRYGVGRYIEYLLSHWNDNPIPFDRIVLYTPGPLDIRLNFNSKLEHRIIPSNHSFGYWEQVILARYKKMHDVLFCPSYVAPVLGRGKTVVTHLGSYEALPSTFPLVQRLKSRLIYQLSARGADQVITVSESSKKDMVRFYGIPADKITVIYLGVDSKFGPINDEPFLESIRRQYLGSNRPYILFVGKLSKRRSIPELISAFSRLKRTRNIQHALLLIGPDSAGQNVPELARKHGIESSVVHREFATHDELVGIYNAADLFIYPSTYEGFGIPVLESMACGIPTIALKNTSFLEFASGVAHLVQDGSEEELYRGMELVLFSNELKAIMREKGPERARQFGWATIANQTMDVLSEVAKR